MNSATGDQSAHGDSSASVSVRAISGGEAGPSGGAAASADGGQDQAANGLDEALQKRLEALIVAHPVMLFMKGALSGLEAAACRTAHNAWACSSLHMPRCTADVPVHTRVG